MHECPVGRIFEGPAARLDAAVRPIGVASDVKIGDQTTRVRVGWRGLIDVDDRPEFVHPQQFPASTIVVSRPTAVQDMREAEIAIFGCLIGLYGFKNKFRVLAFYIDNNIDFVHRVNCLLKD